MSRRLIAALMVSGVVVSGCAGNTPVSLDISSRTGYVVVVEETASSLAIGFAADRDAVAGTPYEVTQAVWRVDDGPWNEPPVTCLGKGQRVELGLASVENAARPGLLIERVVWLVCLPPE